MKTLVETLGVGRPAAVRCALRSALLAGASSLAITAASAQTTIPAGTNVGAYLTTNLSAVNNNFVLGGNAAWNTVLLLDSLARQNLTLDGAGFTISVPATDVLSPIVNNTNVTISNLNFVGTAGSTGTVFYYLTSGITSDLTLNDVTFTSFTGASGLDANIFYMNTTNATVVNVTAGGANGVTFSNNVGIGDAAGVASIFTGTLNFHGNYTFNSNVTENYGGAIAMYQADGRMTFNGTTTFNNNRAINYFGGAVDIWGGASTLTFNGPAFFNANYVSSAATGAGEPRGGAINIGYTSPGTGAAIVQFNDTVVFDGNYVISTAAGASARGGAISAFGNGVSYDYRYIFNAPAIFQNNYAAKVGTGAGGGYGGAIYYESAAASVSLTSGTQFLNNYASTAGGAIYLQEGTISLSAMTDGIVFQGNRHQVSFDGSNQPIAGTGVPNAIYLGSSGTLNLNASAGFQIQLHDPISSIVGSTIIINKTGAGEVVFYGDNGATTTFDSNIQANTVLSDGYFTLSDGVGYGSASGGSFSASGGVVRGDGGARLRAGSVAIGPGATVAGNGGLFTVETPSFTVQGGGAFGGFGTLASTSAINLTGIALGSIDAGNTLNITSTLAGGGGGLAMQGAGTLILSAVNSYAGTTTVNAGTLQTGATDAIATSSAVAVNSGATLDLGGFSQRVNNLSGGGAIILGSASLTANNNTDTVFSGAISGAGAMLHTGANQLTLSGTNTYTGGTSIVAGTLRIGDGGTTGSIAGNISSGGTVAFDRSDTATFGGIISGAGAVRQDGSGTLVLTGVGSSVGSTVASAGTLSLAQAGALTTGSHTTQAGAATAIGGTSQLVVGGALTQATGSALEVTLGSNDPAITAATAALDGSLTVIGLSASAPGSASALAGTQFAVITTTGGISGDFASVNLGVSPVDYLQLGGGVTNGGLDYTVGFGLSWLAGSTAGHGTFTLGAGETFNVDVALSDQSASVTGWDGTTLTKAGAGTLILSAVNSYTGATLINGGTLRTGVANAIASGSAVTVAAGATFDLDGFSQVANDLSGAGSITLGSATLTANSTASTIIAGTISGAGALTKTGAGTLTLTGTNSYTGGTTITGGTLQIGGGGTTGSITGTVANSGTLAFNRSDTMTFGGTISGSGTVEQIGAGTTILTGVGSSVGSTLVSSGTLSLAQTDALTTGSHTTQAGAVTTIGGTSQLVVSGALTQAAGSALEVTLGSNHPAITAASAVLDGSLTIIGFSATAPGSASALAGSQFTVITTTSGIIGDFATVNLGGAISPVDYLQLAGGVSNGGFDYRVGFGLSWLAGSTAGHGTFTLGAGETFDVDVALSDQPASATGWDGATLTKAGAGTLILSAVNTYTGSTLINAGTLRTGVVNAIASSSAVTVAAGATFDLDGFSQVANNLSGAGAITLGSATLTANSTASTTFAGTISGAGALDKTGAGTLTLTGTNSYTGGTTITGGGVVIGDGGVAGSITGNVANDGTLAFSRSDTATFGGVISGTGTVEQIGTGTTVLTGANTYSGGTTITAGTLQIGDGGTTGSIAGDVANSGTLAFNRTDTVTFGGVISGTGSVEQTGTGTTVLTGANTYTGGTMIAAGTLQIGDSGTAGSITGNVINSGTLAFDRSDTVTFGGIISGSGAVEQIGTGTLVLTGVGLSMGSTLVSSGTLSLAQAGAVTTGNHTTQAGAVTSIGGASQLVVVGALTQAAGSALEVVLGSNEPVIVASSALLDGSLTVSGFSAGVPGSASGLAGTQFRVITTTGGITGDFASVNPGGVSPVDYLQLAGGVSSNGLDYTIGFGLSWLAGPVAGHGTFTLGAGDTFDVDVALSDQPASATGWDGATLTKAGAGTLILSAVNSYTGATLITDGTLRMGVANAIVPSSAVAVNSGATLDLGGFSQTVNNLSGAGAVTLGSEILTVNSTADTTFAGTISGTGMLFHNITTGTNTLTLTGTNTYSGGTWIGAGTLQIGDGGTTGSIVGDIANHGTLASNRSDSVTFGGVISGAGVLEQIGTGTTVLTGANTYAGGTTITAGTLQIGDGGATGSIVGDVANDGTLAFNRSDTVTFGGVVSGTGTVEQIGSGTTVLTGANTYSGGTIITAGTLQIGDGGTTGSITGNVANNGTLAFNRFDTMTFGGVITGTGMMEQIGTGTTILTGAGSSASITQVSSGTLSLAQAGVLTTGSHTTQAGATTAIGGSSQLVVVGGLTQAAGSALEVTLGGNDPAITAASAALDGSLTVNGFSATAPGSASALTSTQFTVISTTGGIAGDFATVSLGGATSPVDYLQLAGGVSNGLDYTVGFGLSWLAGPVAGHGTFTLGAGDTFDVDVALSDQAASATGWDGTTLTKAGAGTLILSAVNGYSGATLIDAGTLRTGAVNALASSSSVTIAAGATFDLDGFSQVANNLSGAGAVTLGSATLTANNASGSTTFGGAISGTGALDKTGSGTLVLAGLNTYTGGTTITGGTLQIGGGGTTGSITGNVANSGTLAFNRSDAMTFGGTISGSGSVEQIGTGTTILTGVGSSVGSTLVSSGTLSLAQTGTLTTGSHTTQAGAVTTIGGSSQLVVSGALTQAAGAVLEVTLGSNAPVITASTAALDGNLTITGFSAGAPGSASALTTTLFTVITTTGGISGDFATVNLGGAASPVDYLQLAGGVSNGGLDYTVGFGLSWLAGGTAGHGTFTLGAGETFDVDMALSDQAASATGWDGTTLTKAGAGTLILSAVNSYTGATLINGGTLRMGAANAIASSSAITVAAGATFDLDGFSQVANNLSGAGSITLGTATLTANNTSGSTTFGGVISGSGALEKNGSGTLILTGANTHSGNTTITGGTLQIGDGGTTGSIISDIINNGTLAFNRSDTITFGGVISGPGMVEQIGTGTTILTGAGSSVGSTLVSSGTLSLVQAGALTTGSHTTHAGAVTAIGGASQLVVSGALTQAAGSALEVTLGSNAPVITAAAAALDGSLTIAGFSAGAAGSASALTSTQFTVITTTGGISGNFASVNLGGAASPVDYLQLAGGISNGGLDYTVGFGLSWLAGGSVGHGTFTLGAGDMFDMDLALSDQAASATGWDGTTLTKAGAGTLILSAVNTYTGATLINGGTLRTGVANAIASSAAVTVAAGATLDLDGFSQVANNLSGAGAVTLGSATLTANNASGSTTFAGMISGAGALTKTGSGALILTGTSTYTGGTTITGGTLQIGDGGTTGSITGNVANDGTLAFNRANIATFGGVISGTGAVKQIGNGITILTGANTYTGATSVLAGILRAGATGVFSPGSAINVAAGAVLDLADFSQTIPGLTNAGFVSLGHVPDTVLTITGNYVGAGGTIGLTTFLDTDNSPSDRLVIQGGTATGSSLLRINNAGGGGALTTGNGILVVDTTQGGTTTANAFTLAQPVIAGPYEYTLHRGSQDTTNVEAWYLRSTAPEPEPQPNYRQEMSLYAAVPSMVQGIGLAMLDTLHHRVGEQEHLRGRMDINDGANPNGAWMRMIAHRNNIDGGGLMSDGPDFEQDITAFQAGLDIFRHESPDGHRDHAGLYFGIGQSNGRVDHLNAGDAGRVRIDAYALGAYWTHFGPGGWYVDAVAQVSLYESSAKSSRTGIGLSDNGWGFAASLEGGYPIALGASGWVLEPQAQLIWQRVSLDGGNDVAARVDYRDADNLIGRLGTRLAGTWRTDPNDPVKRTTAWARASVYHDFRGDNRMQISSDDGPVMLQSDMGGTWVGFNAGVSAQITRNTSLYANATYETDFKGDRQGFGGMAGIRINW